jgi:hypothetical protein
MINKSRLVSQIIGAASGLLLVNTILSLPAFSLTLQSISLPLSRCLPKDIKLSDVVSATMVNSQTITRVTVEQKLKQLKARCILRDRKLVDGQRKPIYFYRLIGCWGTPPPNYQEILQKQREEIERLSASYTVISMTCNPSGFPIP